VAAAVVVVVVVVVADEVAKTDADVHPHFSSD
jgi:hypothetical protein